MKSLRASGRERVLHYGTNQQVKGQQGDKVAVTMFYKQGDRVRVNNSAMPPTHAGEIGKITGVIKASGGWVYQVELPIEDRPVAPVLLLSASEIDPAPKERKPASHWQSGFE